MSELLIIAIVALIVVGPKDLPMLLKRIGQFMAKLRGMAAEFRASFDEMARQSELDELRKEVEAMRKGQFLDLGEDSPTLEISQAAKDIEASLADVGVNFGAPPMGAQHAEFQAAQQASAVEAPKPKRVRKAPAKAAPAPKKAATSKMAAAKPAAPRKARAKKTAEGKA